MKRHLIKTAMITFAGFVFSTSSPAAPLPITGPIYNPGNGHLYYLLQSDLQVNSEAEAQVLGGHLVTINDAAENNWVSSTFGNYGGITRDLWLGLTFQGGSYVWADNEPFSYSNWEPGAPNTPGIENFVHMFGGSTPPHVAGWVPAAWNDIIDESNYPLNFTGVERDIFGVVEVVPEPSAFALLTLAGACLLKRKQSPARI